MRKVIESRILDKWRDRNFDQSFPGEFKAPSQRQMKKRLKPDKRQERKPCRLSGPEKFKDDNSKLKSETDWGIEQKIESGGGKYSCKPEATASQNQRIEDQTRKPGNQQIGLIITQKIGAIRYIICQPGILMCMMSAD